MPLYRRWIDWAALVAGSTLLFLMVVVPTAYTTIVVGVLTVTIALVLARWALDRRVPIDRTVVGLGVAYAFVGAGYVGLGLLRHNPGAVAEARVFVLWPIVFVALVGGIDSVRALRWIDHVLLVAALAIGLYSLDFVLVSLKWLPAWAFYDLRQDARIVFYPGYVQFNLNSLASLFFLTPYLMARLADLQWEGSRLVRSLLVVSLVLTLAVTVFALRIALLVIVVLAAPALILVVGLALPRARRLPYLRRVVLGIGSVVILFLVVMSAAVATGHISPANVARQVVAGFDFAGSNPGAQARNAQFFALTNGWLHSPLIGSGLGAVASVVRSQSQPWAYELSYNALLFQTGILGTLVYLGGVLWIFSNGGRIIASESPLSRGLRPVLVGSVCFLLANATNPYLEKFDYMWVIFLPVAYVNLWLLSFRPGNTIDLLDFNVKRRIQSRMSHKSGRTLAAERSP